MASNGEADILNRCPLIDPAALIFRRAVKTQPIRARPVETLVADLAMLPHLLLQTLEGNEPLNPGMMICIGPANDVWQQTPEKLLAKYHVAGADESGWLTCVPRPDNEADACRIQRGQQQVGPDGEFSVIGLWGEQHGTLVLQFGRAGDFVCRSVTDPRDVWIVRGRLFEASYEFR